MFCFVLFYVLFSVYFLFAFVLSFLFLSLVFVGVVLLGLFVFFGLWGAGRSGRPGGRACRRELDSSQVTEVVAGNGFEQ